MIEVSRLTKVYGASLPRMREQDLGAVEHLEGTSPAWPFTQAELHARFTDCASPLLSSSRIQQALGQIESVDKLKDIRELTRTLTS